MDKPYATGADNGIVIPAATDLADRCMPSVLGIRRNRLLGFGRIAAALGIVLCGAIQLVASDLFPPDVSVSQYGIGPHGWVFTLWTVVVAISIPALLVARPGFRRAALPWVVVGGLGLVVMGLVRTDAGGLQQSGHAKVHMIAAIVGLVAIPIGMAVGLRTARACWRRSAWLLVVLSAVALVMVLASAAGAATFGLDAPHSWALWQSVAVTVDMALLVVFAASSPAEPIDCPERG